MRSRTRFRRSPAMVVSVAVGGRRVTSARSVAEEVGALTPADGVAVEGAGERLVLEASSRP